MSLNTLQFFSHVLQRDETVYLALPENSAPRYTVVLCHGGGGGKF